MSGRSRLFVLFALLAVSAAVFFLAIAVDPDMYAPGAGTVTHHLGGHHPFQALKRRLPLPLSARKGFTASLALHKLYSIVAFAVVGFFAAPLIPRPVRLRRDTGLIAGFSLIIEVAQKVGGSHESYASNLFDVACGAVGGLLGALVWNRLTNRLTFAKPVRRRL